MYTHKSLTFLFALFFSIPISQSFGNIFFETPSSFNPVGSGARAIGRGGAFIGSGDDPTSGSWNPGTLILVKRKPEISIVINCPNLIEYIDFGANPEASGPHELSETDLNFLGATYPFVFMNRNMVLSITYQQLFDFIRHWTFTIKENRGADLSENHWDYQQIGKLSALGVSYCVEIVRRFSLGITLNFWKDGLTQNNWKQNYKATGTGVFNSYPYIDHYLKTEHYSFDGFNVNLGMLWRVNKKLSIGAVLKTPFTAKIEHTKKIVWDHKCPAYPKVNDSDSTFETFDEEMEMPISYGIGFSYKFSKNFFISTDIYTTRWDNFIYRDINGNETCPITGQNFHQSNTKPTYQVRIGAEYLFLNIAKDYVIPVRCGLFYDPAPAEKSPDDIYGFSMGLGFTQNDLFSVDLAYQYRFGNNVGEYQIKYRDFSMDIREHQIYVSMNWYKF